MTPVATMPLAAMSVGSAWLVLPAATVVALGASYILVTRIERLSASMHVSEAMLGVFVALAANSPEVTSAVTAFSRGQTTIGAGVVLGSNVFNLAALLGLSGIVAARIDLHRRVVVLEGLPAIWIALVTLGVMLTAWSPSVGLVLVVLVVVPYLVVSAGRAAWLRTLGVGHAGVEWLNAAVREEESELSPAHTQHVAHRRDAALAVASLVLVVGSSITMEQAAQQLGAHFSIAPLVVGGVVLAAVTSLPNAVGAVFLASHGRGAAVLSEAMNSNMLNVLVGLLVPGVLIGLGHPTGSDVLVAGWYGALTVLCVALTYVTRSLRRSSGVLIVACYAAFVVVAVARH